MNKQDLINAVDATCGGINKVQIGGVVDVVLAVITSELVHGGSVTLTGFGSFSVAARAARQGRNPRTGEPVAIGAHRAVKFTPGKHLKGAVK